MSQQLLESSNQIEPTNYFFVIDLSGSMYEHIKEMKEVITRIHQNVKCEDTVSLAYFSGYDDFDWICKNSNIRHGWACRCTAWISPR